MGILNVTPDSFAEPSPTLDSTPCIERAMEMQEERGGHPRRRRRIHPAWHRARRRQRGARRACFRSSKGLAGTRACADFGRYLPGGGGAGGDRRGGVYHQRHQRVTVRAARSRRSWPRSGAALVLMHMRGRPKDDVCRGRVRRSSLAEVAAELQTSMAVAAAAGVAARPPDRRSRASGLPNGRTDSYGVLARLSALAAALDRPVLVGPSRKSFMREALGGRPAPERDWGTAAAVTAAVLAGAHIVRVHAVARDGAGRASGGRNSEPRHGRHDVVDRLLRRPPIGWWDIADIVVVSLIIYEMLMLIRGTRAVQMALGGAMIVGLFYLSRLEPSRNRQLPDSQFCRVRRLRGDRAVSGGHSPRPRASGPRAVFPLLRQAGIRRGIDRGADRRGRTPVRETHRRHHRDRAAGRIAELHRRRDSARCRADCLDPQCFSIVIAAKTRSGRLCI